MKTVRVVAAIIIENGKVFATQRGYGEFKDGWEFPGGKIEPGETPEEAIVREILKAIYVKTAMGITVCGIGCSFRYTKHLSRQVSSMQSLQIQTSGLKIRAKILLPER